MKLSAELGPLQAWVNSAQLAQITYFRVRRTLFDKLARTLKSERELQDRDHITMAYETFNAIRSFLQSRNDKANEDSRLSFQRAIEDLQTQIDDEAGSEGVEDETGVEAPAEAPAE